MTLSEFTRLHGGGKGRRKTIREEKNAILVTIRSAIVHAYTYTDFFLLIHRVEVQVD